MFSVEYTADHHSPSSYSNTSVRKGSLDFCQDDRLKYFTHTQRFNFSVFIRCVYSSENGSDRAG